MKIVYSAKVALSLMAAGSSLLLLAAGCSRERTAVKPKLTKTLNACDVMGQTDAVILLGGVVTQARGPEVVRPDGGSSVSNCSYSSDQARTVNILLRQDSDAASISAQFNAARSAVEGIYNIRPQAVQGLGEAAFWVGGSANQLNVLKGGNWVTIMVFGLSTDDRLTLARSVAARIVRSF